MNQKAILNPQIVHDAAAFLFWTLAESVGVLEANETVIESAGRCLLNQAFSIAVLAQYGIDKLQPNEQREFANAIADEANRFAAKEENMIGVIYMEDADHGKTPSAEHIDTKALQAIPKKITLKGAKIEKIGSLCLRHPLPAVVLSEAKPRGGVIEVGDTFAALGFDLPMFLTNVASKQLAPGLFVLTGIFQIAVPSARHGNLWSSAIQNSARFISGINIYGTGGPTAVEVEW